MSNSLRFTALLFAANGLLWADGGTVQLQKQVGPFSVTVFSDPSPVRVGKVDLSVLVQQSATKAPVLDAQVLFHLRRPGGGEILTYTLPARHSDASNKMLYAANADLPSPGNWQMGVDISRQQVQVSTYGTLKVVDKEPPLATYWPYFVMVPMLALLFVVNRWLRRRYRRAPLAPRSAR